MTDFTLRFLCNGPCEAYFHGSINHDDPQMMPQLARNLWGSAVKEGWVEAGDDRHYCPECAKTRDSRKAAEQC